MGNRDACGDTTKIGLATLKYGDLFTFAEVGPTPRFRRLSGRSRYSIAPWYMMGRQRAGLPASKGLILSVNQELSNNLTLIVRHAIPLPRWTARAPMSRSKRRRGWRFAAWLATWMTSPASLFRSQFPATASCIRRKSPSSFTSAGLAAAPSFRREHRPFSIPAGLPNPETVGVFYVRLRTTFSSVAFHSGPHFRWRRRFAVRPIRRLDGWSALPSRQASTINMRFRCRLA